MFIKIDNCAFIWNLKSMIFVSSNANGGQPINKQHWRSSLDYRIVTLTLIIVFWTDSRVAISWRDNGNSKTISSKKMWSTLLTIMTHSRLLSGWKITKSWERFCILHCTDEWYDFSGLWLLNVYLHPNALIESDVVIAWQVITVETLGFRDFKLQ
jgi:hypothetical protein